MKQKNSLIRQITSILIAIQVIILLSACGKASSENSSAKKSSGKSSSVESVLESDNELQNESAQTSEDGTSIGALSSTSTSGAAGGALSSGSASSGTKAPGGPYVRPTPKMNGKKITVAYWNNLGSLKKGDSTVDDGRLTYYSQIEKELGCKLEWKFIDREQMNTNLIATSLSGTKLADIAVSIFWNTASVLSNRAAVDLRSVSSMDLSADYWWQFDNDLLNINGVQRAAACGFTLTPVSETPAVLFNKRLISELKLDSPYELYKNNKWNISKLREMAKAAAATGISGIATPDLGACALTGNILATQNIQPISKAPGGLFAYNMTDSKMVGALKYIQDWYTKDNSVFINTDVKAQRTRFRNGQSLFYIFQLSELSEFTEMTDDYGVVPFPKGDGQSNYIGDMNWNTSLLLIPSAVKGQDLYDAGVVAQALAYYSRNDNKNRKTEITGRYLRDSESAAMLDTISNSARHLPSKLISSPRFPQIEVTVSSIIGSVSNPAYDFAQGINKQKNTGKSLVNQFNANITKK